VSALSLSRSLCLPPPPLNSLAALRRRNGFSDDGAAALKPALAQLTALKTLWLT
jgi:hypothetical protein